MKTRRGTPEFSISFLDVICCGFGAVILLLMITKTVQPQILERSTIVADGRVADLTEQLFEIRGETTVLNRDLKAKQEQISEYRERIAILQGALASTRSRYDSLETTRNSNSIIEQELAIAMQELSSEQTRLQAKAREPKNQLIGGIPVDSEYIVFVIDTSGSMAQMWDRVLQEVTNTLKIYPSVKGMQFVNGEFDHLFPSSVGNMLEDNLRERKKIFARLKFPWAQDSSRLVKGISDSVRTYGGWSSEQVSIYVFADDLAPNNIMGRGRAEYVDALQTIRQQNRSLSGSGRLKTRIHFVAFPLAVQSWMNQPGVRERQADFINFARALTTQNDGTLVTLTNLAR
ncbi:VWA domain-containing protein [Luminiphilus sp.]|nr:VWA domain-containing protein [Luminiphilus sp.]